MIQKLPLQTLQPLQSVTLLPSTKEPIMVKDFLDRIGHALNIYHTQYYTDELTDTIFFVTQQKYAGVNTSSNSLYDFLSLGFKTKQTIQSCEKSEPVWMCGCLG